VHQRSDGRLDFLDLFRYITEIEFIVMRHDLFLFWKWLIFKRLVFDSDTLPAPVVITALVAAPESFRAHNLPSAAIADDMCVSLVRRFISYFQLVVFAALLVLELFFILAPIERL